MKMNSANDDITEDEAELYDRQIRLWGVEAQKKLRACNLLLINLSSLGSEIIKNLVLCGIHSITIIDDQVVSSYDSMGHLFTESRIGEKRGEVALANIQSLNPRVKIEFKDWDVVGELSAESDRLASIIAKVDVVCVTNHHSDTLIKLNNLARKVNPKIKFYAACNWGFYGFGFNDLGDSFNYLTEEITPTNIEVGEEPVEKKQKIEPEKIHVKKTLEYIPLEKALSMKAGKSNTGCINKRTSIVYFITRVLFRFHEKFQRFPSPDQRVIDRKELEEIQKTVLKEFDLNEDQISEKLCKEKWWDNIFAEISSVCAVIGGIVGQDILRTVSEKDTPIRNFVFFNGIKCNSNIETIGIST